MSLKSKNLAGLPVWKEGIKCSLNHTCLKKNRILRSFEMRFLTSLPMTINYVNGVGLVISMPRVRQEKSQKCNRIPIFLNIEHRIMNFE